MIKNILFYLLLLLLIGITSSTSISLKEKKFISIDSVQTSCEECYFFFLNEIPIVRNSINQGESTCSGVCENLANSTLTDKDICLAICEYEGFYYFQYYLWKGKTPTDICNYFHFCKENQGSGANIDTVIISPESGVVGTNFSIKVDYQVTGTIYTGQVNVFIMDHFTEKSKTIYFFYYLPGVYSNEVIFQTISSLEHQFWSGNYSVLVSIQSEVQNVYSQVLTSLFIEPTAGSSMNVTDSSASDHSYNASYF